MRKQKTTPLKTLEDLVKTYDKATLVNALGAFQTHNIAWDLFRAALIKEYQSQVIYTMDNAGKSGKQVEAAFHSGCAQTMLDTATTLVDKYIQLLTNQSGVVEDTRPTEE
jgi:hypothetical protein